MSIDVEIRQATGEDAEELAKWRMEALHDAFPDEGDEILWAKVNAATDAFYMLSLLDGSHVAAFADFLGEPVGFGGMCLTRELPTPDNPSGKCARITGVYTRRAYRNQGVDAQVVKWLEDEARAQGACVL